MQIRHSVLAATATTPGPAAAVFPAMTVPEPLDKLAEILVNASGSYSLPLRFRALFALRNIDSDAVVAIIAKGMNIARIAV